MPSSNGYPGDLAHSEKDESGMGDEGLCLEMVLRRRGFRGWTVLMMVVVAQRIVILAA
jgi:hypothetical protein